LSVYNIAAEHRKRAIGTRRICQAMPFSK
jgi:hypothetical protein